MSDKGIIRLIVLFLAVAVLGLIAELVYEGEIFGSYVLNIGITLSGLLALLLMIRNGTLVKTIYWRVIKFLIGVVLIGAMFKILHFPGAHIILIGGHFGIALAYTMSFFMKSPKKPLDFLKWLWALSAFIGSPLIIIHFIAMDYRYISLGMFWVTFLVFLLTDYQKKPEVDQE